MLLALAVVALAGGCKIEEDLHLHADGSGEYRVRMTLQKMLGGTPQVRQALIENGFEIVEESETHDSDVIVARRTFEQIDEIGELQGSLQVEDRGWLRRSYHLKVRVDDVQGQATERTFRIHLPVGIEESSAGRLDGKTLFWDGTHGGDLELVATGLVVPGGERLVYAAVGALLLGLLVPVARRVRRAGSAPDDRSPIDEWSRCPSCGKPRAAGAFCTHCGAAARPAEAE